MVPQSRSPTILWTYMYTKVYTSLPDWLSLSRPNPEGQVVNVRRECQVALEIRSKELPALSSQRPVKWKARQSALAALAGGTVTPQNRADDLSRCQSMSCDIPTPRGTRAPTQEPMILSSPSPCSLSEGEYQAMPWVPYSNPQTPAARRPGTSTAAQPLRRKQGREEDGTEPQDADWGRHVRPRREQQQRNDTAGTEGFSATAANPSRSQPATTATGSGTTHRPTQRGVPSSGTLSSPATSATSASQPDPSNMEPNPPPRPAQVQQGLSQSAETHSTVLRATKPPIGPVSGGIEIWLTVEDLPTTFTLYARFGNAVTATVSPMFHLQS